MLGNNWLGEKMKVNITQYLCNNTACFCSCSLMFELFSDIGAAGPDGQAITFHHWISLFVVGHRVFIPCQVYP